MGGGFRDLGGCPEGHLWAHVQVIKPPKLLELSGPLFMSYPAANHHQYRLTEEGTSTRLSGPPRIRADLRRAPGRSFGGLAPVDSENSKARRIGDQGGTMKNDHRQTAVSRSEWTKARLALLEKEKRFTRLKDELCEERQRLPWLAVEKTTSSTAMPVRCL